MRRDITLNTTYPEGTTVELVYCDKYLRDLHVESQTLSVGLDGVVSANVSVNENEACWVFSVVEEKKTFWVYEGEGVQVIDLTVPLYKHRGLPVFLNVAPQTMKANVNFAFSRLACGSPLVCEEEQRFVCRFSRFVEGEDDEEMCAVNTALST